MAELNNPIKYFTNLEKRAKYKLIKRYDKPLSYHDVKIINDILYNEKTHYVEQFKEYLIYEDYNEFLKRFYKTFELNIKLPKILTFYEKYSKIYANYTVIPESKYMYKNIKRKQKMIDQMQNNNIDSEYEDFEDSNDDMTNTVFSSKIMNSIYRRTLTINKSDNGNSEQSINNFVDKINDIENNITNNCLKNNYINNKYGKSQKEIMLPVTKFNKNYLIQKHTPKSTKLNANNKNEQNTSNRNNGNISQKNKIIDIQFTYSKKNLQSELNKNKANYNNNINGNYKSNNINNPNLIFINSYVHKNNNNNTIFKNNKSLGNTTNSNSNNSNTFQGQKNSLNINNISKQKLPTALLKQNIIKNSNNMNYKENMSITHINNYFNNATNNLKNNQKYKLSLGETLLKCDKIILSTNTSGSPNIINEKVFSSPSSKTNIFNSKKQLLNDKQKNKEYINQPLSSNKIITTKKLKSHLLAEYNSFGNSLTFLSNKFLDNQKLTKINKLNKKKINKKLIDIQNKNNNQNKDNENYINSEIQSNINFKKPQSLRNYGHSKILSANNTNSSNKININNNENNRKCKITVGLKQDLKNNSKKIMSSPCSPSNSSSNFYFNSNLNTHKEKDSENVESNIKRTLEEYNKKKVIHNFNIVNNIHDNSTQINIYTGNELYKSLHINNNSVFNSSNLTPANTFSKSPIGVEGVGNKNKKSNIGQINSISNTNNNSFKSIIKEKEKEKENQNKYNLNLKKIINKRILDGDKAIISERQMTKGKLFEKLGKYFFKSKNDNYNTNSTNNTNAINNYNNNANNNTQSDNNNKLINNKHIYNKHNILYNSNYTKNFNNDNNKLINKIINKSNSNSNKALKPKINNDTPIKSKLNQYITKNHRKMQNICLSPYNNDIKKLNKASSKQNINYNNIISNLNDLKNIGIDEGNKFIIHSERNKNSKIVFK